MYNAQSVIERVQSALKSAGISQKAMLQDCGMSENTLKRMNDERGMSSFYLARIADYLGVSVDYLLGRDAQTKSAKDDAVRSAIYKKVQSMSDSQAQKLLAFLESVAEE